VLQAHQKGFTGRPAVGDVARFAKHVTGASAIQRGGSDFVAGRYASCGDGDALLFFRAVSILLAVRQTRREKVANLQSAGSFRPE
jgi:hypothetical protein